MSYIPHKDSEFCASMRFVFGAAIPPHKQRLDAFFSNILSYATPRVTSTPPVWPHIPVAELTALSGLYDVWAEAYAKMAGLHTKADTEVKNEARKTSEAALRKFVQRYLMWDPVTNADRLALLLQLRDENPTPTPVPNIQPNTEAVPSGKRKHTVTAINPVTKSSKRPPGANGVAFACKLRLPSEPKAEARDMPSEFQTSAVRDFQWEEADIGKVADYATAYEKKGGARGQ
jgi:hypothetical protein